MSKFYIDTEFIEGFHKPLFGKRRHFIDLISIGIVCENGAEYSAISSEYNYKDASDWVKENVIERLYIATVDGFRRQFSFESNFHKHYGKPNKQIAQEISEFIYKQSNYKATLPVKIEIVGYFSGFDYVLFSSIFGTMMDLPLGFPMYFIDLKQTLDEKVEFIFNRITAGIIPIISNAHERKLDFIRINDHSYPKQNNEHLAIDDAKWNRTLDTYLQSYK